MTIGSSRKGDRRKEQKEIRKPSKVLSIKGQVYALKVVPGIQNDEWKDVH